MFTDVTGRANVAVIKRQKSGRVEKSECRADVMAKKQRKWNVIVLTFSSKHSFYLYFQGFFAAC